MTRKPSSLLILGLMMAGVLNACYQAKTPEQVAKDTAAAEATAARSTAKIEERANDKVNGAQGVVRDEQAAAAHTRALETQKVTDAQAEGNHKIALAQCESLSGEPQKACKEQADTAYETALAEARQAKADSDPRP